MTRKELINIARRQVKEYEKTKANEKAAADKQKHEHEKLQTEMMTYEIGRGARPPTPKVLREMDAASTQPT